MWYTVQVGRNAGIAQLVEHVIGNDEVISPNLIISSITVLPNRGGPLFFVFAIDETDATVYNRSVRTQRSGKGDVQWNRSRLSIGIITESCSPTR